MAALLGATLQAIAGFFLSLVSMQQQRQDEISLGEMKSALELEKEIDLAQAQIRSNDAVDRGDADAVLARLPDAGG